MYLFGGRGGNKVKPQYTGLATQTSTSVVAVTIGFGLSRVAPNIIYQTDFQSHAQKQKTGKGLGGSQVVGYTYSGTYVLALGWGPATGCRRVWKDQSKPASYQRARLHAHRRQHPTDAMGLSDNGASEPML
jgi:hypothetical protein